VEPEDIQRVLHGMGVEVSAGQAWELLFHIDAVLRANETLNLTSITDRSEAIRLHVIDSLTCVPFVVEAPEGLLADIGSGAGFPGIPLGIATDRDTMLIESRSRKAAFLEAVVSALDHRFEVLPIRAEDLASEQPESVAVVTARAVGELPVLAELAAPLLRFGGRLIAMKGSPSDEELARGVEAGRRVGMEEIARESVGLPAGDETRTIVIYERKHAAEVELPRRAGMAAKRPLA
jgi:16S rRNA (guanine527-N7)-methyltransferase